MDEKHDLEFDHFQVEVGTHIWGLGSLHEYCKMVDYQLHSSLGGGQTRNHVFFIQFTVFVIVNHIGISTCYIVFEG